MQSYFSSAISEKEKMISCFCLQQSSFMVDQMEGSSFCCIQLPKLVYGEFLIALEFSCSKRWCSVQNWQDLSGLWSELLAVIGMSVP